ncbi:MAG: acyltransferase family protein [Trueperella sp.]|uniref:acyltransferase family protein n=1 Tax=Trueperella sp. TaxID=2699835 RepID=UPI002A91BEDE|nr:acyltransferase family protein [Trueperella sp.]MDY5403394.1 acyltransferase family protein [Trueperella sp.]
MPGNTANSPSRSYRIRGLDGLRAIGALFVLVYHLLPSVGGAGFIGVDVFFVISGFLITALLLKEHDSTGVIDLPSFLHRRYRRLLPAVALMVVVTLSLGRLISADAVTQARWQALGALTGTYNWFQIANGSSYFEAQEPLLLNNMWSLAVEQQFYLVWPVVVMVLALAARRAGHLGRRIQIGAAAAIAVVSLALHAWLVGGDVTRAYVGTDTHIFGLMIGAGIAFALPGIMKGRPRTASALWGAGSWAALAGLTVLTFAVPDASWFYPWGMLLASALAGVAIRGILPDVAGTASETLAGLLESRPMVWIGQRSYGIYLWHWPLWVLATYHIHMPRPLAAAVVLAASVTAAHLSFTYVETPIRRKGLVGWVRSMRALPTVATAWLTMGALALTATFALALVTSTDMTEAQRAVAAGEEALATHKATPDAGDPDETAEPGDDGESPTTPATTPTATATPEPTAEPTPGQTPDTGADITIIGDSVTLAAAPALLETYPDAVVDGEVSRSIWVFKQIADTYASQGKLRDTVVISLGTNGAISMQTARDIMDYLGPDRRVVWVTAAAPNAEWVPRSNATIAQIATEYPDRVRVADWAAIAAAHPEHLASDGIHPGGTGGAEYAAEIKRAIDSF